MSQTKAQLIGDLTQALEFTTTASTPAEGLYLKATNQLALATNSVDRITAGTSELVINESGASVDFRVEGDTNANLLFVDASTDRIGVGTSSPTAALTIVGTNTSGAPVLHLVANASQGDYARMTFYESDGTTSNAYINSDGSNGLKIGANNGPLNLQIGASPALTIDTSSRVGIGTSSITEKLTLLSNNDTSAVDNGLGIYRTAGDDKVTINCQGGAARFIADGGSGYIPFRFARYNGTTLVEDLHISSSGDIGIGTTSPTNKIHIYASNNAARTDHIRLQNDGADNGTESAIIFTQNSATEQACIFSAKDASGPSLNIEISGAQMGRFTNNGQFVVGTVPTAFPTSTLVVQGASDGTDGNPILHFSRDKTIGSATGLGLISFGRNDRVGARIYGISQGTWTEGSSHPTDLVFETVQNSSTTFNKVLKITRDGELNVSDTGDIYNSDGYTNAKLFVYDVRSGGHSGTFVNNNVNYAQANHGVLWSGCSRSASSSYVLYAGTSGNGNSLNYGADYEFRLYGDGNGKCDGSWTGGGADYAELFEWVDGNPEGSDRRGISVVLEGNKIREAVAGEDPIGVISANPTILGDAGWNKWTEKHLRDDFGSYIMQEHSVVEWTDEEGKQHTYEDWNIPADVVVPDDAVTNTHDENGKRFTHRAVNPAYDPSLEYIPREERAEWDAVGLMGKLRIRKGQVTGARWIKMRDISDNVEEWLVR